MHKPSFLRLALLLPLWAAQPTIAPALRAQIVNIEDQRKALDSLGWFGQADLNANLTENVNTVTTLGASLRLDRLGKRGNVLILSDYRLIQVEGSNAVNAGFAHLRYGYEPEGRDGWRWESFTQVQYDQRLRLDLRALVGTGIRRRLYRRVKSRGYVGILYMYEYDEISQSDIFYRDHRLSNYLTLAYQPSKGVRLASTTYYQPRLPDFNLARVSTITSVQLNFAGNFSFTTRFNLTHDARVNRDLPEVPATTYQWTNGLRYNF